MRDDVVVMGAGGASGQRIARRLAARGVRVRLAGRRRESLAPLADELGAAFIEADATRPGPAVEHASILVNTVGPFATLAPAITEACLAAGVAYLDIANEFQATTAVLALAERASRRGTVLVTGAGFGPAVTESLVLGLLPQLTGPAAAVRVAAAPAAEGVSPGVQATVAQASTEGTAWYAGGALARAALGTGATRMMFGGNLWHVLPAPTADLEAARQASGADDVTAYFAAPGQQPAMDGTSYAYAEVRDGRGASAASLATLALGLDVTAAIATETACRILGSNSPPPAGAWTPGALFGPGLVAGACAISITPADPATVWHDGPGAAR